MSEKILVVPKETVFKGENLFQGFQPACSMSLWTQIAAQGLFLDRDRVEYDTHFKQPIVYLVLRNKDKIFTYRRIQGSGEKRLLDKYSFGLGGHINPVSTDKFKSLIISNLIRELKEEVYFKGPFSYSFLGFLNDEKEEVGKYHFGLVFLISTLSPEVTVREKDKLQGGLIPIPDLDSYRDRLENWSSILLPYVITEVNERCANE